MRPGNLIKEEWKRIAGIHLEEDGTLGCVWLAHDERASTVYLYDAALFRNEVPVVIADGIAARGRYYPVAWRKKDKPIADMLLDNGIEILPDPCVDDQAMAEVISKQVWQSMRASRFRVEQRVGEWFREYESFFKDRSKVPLEGFPLMAATRHAIEMLNWAEPERGFRGKQKNHPDIAVI